MTCCTLVSRHSVFQSGCGANNFYFILDCSLHLLFEFLVCRQRFHLSIDIPSKYSDVLQMSMKTVYEDCQWTGPRAFHFLTNFILGLCRPFRRWSMSFVVKIKARAGHGHWVRRFDVYSGHCTMKNLLFCERESIRYRAQSSPEQQLKHAIHALADADGCEECFTQQVCECNARDFYEDSSMLFCCTCAKSVGHCESAVDHIKLVANKRMLKSQMYKCLHQMYRSGLNWRCWEQKWQWRK